MRIKFSLIIASILLVQCQAQKTALTLTHATQQGWAGGPAGSGSGVNYSLEFTANKKGTYKFAYLYNREVILPVNHTSVAGVQDSVIILKVGETVKLSAERYYPGEIDMRVHRDSLLEKQSKAMALKAGSLPVFEGKGLLIFYFNGKKQYAPITAFKELPTIAYP